MPYINVKELRELESKKRVRSQVHPILDLSIWNYEETVHYLDKWCPITLMARALTIESSTGRIVGRSLPKFFNFNETCKSATIPKHEGDFRIFDKLDGSLFVLFSYNDQWVYCSRGSFTSEQAKEGETILKENFPQHVNLDRNLTYVFELIYPEGRIVVDYKDERTVKFITAYEVDGTEHLIIDKMKNEGFDVVVEHTMQDKTLEELCSLNIPEHEGYVIRYSNGDRVKVKFEDYIKLHKTRTNFSNKTIFDKWLSKVPLSEALKDIPDEFNDWYRTGIDELDRKYKEIIDMSHSYVNDNLSTERKDFYKQLESNSKLLKIKGVINAIYNNKSEDIVSDIALKTMSHKDIKEIGVTPRWKTYPKKTGVAIFLIGCSGTGKSYWTERFMRNRRDAVRVSRDALRNALYVITDSRASHDYYNHKDLTKREETVTSLCKKIADGGFADGKTVVFDNTNVDFKFLKLNIESLPSDVEVHFEIFNPMSEEYQLTHFDTTLNESEVVNRLHKRTVDRGMEVPKKIITKQLKNMSETLKRLDELKKVESTNVISQDTSLPEATIFDIDGTLALCGNRNVFDMSKVNLDIGVPHVINLAKVLYNSGMKIILCSGREEKARSLTVEWMDKHGVLYEELHFRRNKDMRKDYIVKEEMWRDLIKRYNIVHMIDDRDQVVNHARSLGFKVSQVAEGNF